MPQKGTVKSDLVPQSPPPPPHPSQVTELTVRAYGLLGPNKEPFQIVSETTVLKPLTLSGSLESFLCHLAIPPHVILLAPSFLTKTRPVCLTFPHTTDFFPGPHPLPDNDRILPVGW